MNLRKRFGMRLLVAAVLIGYTLLYTNSTRTIAEEPSHTKEIADLEKQIQELNKRTQSSQEDTRPSAKAGRWRVA